MEKIEMAYIMSVAVSLVSLTVFGTMVWEELCQRHNRKKRAKVQRIANRVSRHNEFIRNNEDYKAVLKW